MGSPTPPPGELTLAKGRRKIAWIPAADAPADWNAIEATDIAKWVDVTCQVARDDFVLGFTESDKVDDAPLCTTTNVQALDADNFEAGASVYRYITDAGVTGSLDSLYAALGEKGRKGWLVERTEPLAKASVDWADGDKIIAYPVETDNPQHPTDLTGYVKRHVPFNPTGDVIYGELDLP